MQEKTRTLPTTARRIGHVALRVVRGPDAGKRFVFEYGQMSEVRGGRDARHAIALTDDSVSLSHFELVRRGEGLHLHDCGSTNGVWGGGLRVHDAEIDVGCRFRVGETELVVERADRVDVPLWESEQFHGMWGASVRMRELFHQLACAAARESAGTPVLLVGEPGVGKERAARALHAASRRSGEPFAYGHARTLTVERAQALLHGRPEGAAGGVVFLDEVAGLTAEVQSLLLGVLAEAEARGAWPGGRVICATSQPLQQRAEEGRFDPDLHRRLRAVTIRVPSLRERAEDIQGLAVHFLGEESAQTGVALQFEAAALQSLAEVPWPGNVRQLRDVVLASSGLAALGEVRREHLQLDGETDAWCRRDRTLRQTLERVERHLYAQVLRAHTGRSAQASAAGLRTPEGLREALRRLGIPLDGDAAWAAAFLREAPCPLCGGAC